MEGNDMGKKIVLVTGVSTGLGRAFAEALLLAGYTVIGTVRRAEAVEEFESLSSGHAFARVLDVTDGERVTATVAEIEAQIGPMYALINNAGYGHEGTLEESPMEELRQQFEVNVFGTVAMIKAVLPFMRGRRDGRIVNVTSMGGLMTMPGLSYYHGSKFALEGISASLRKEVKGFGIGVTAVEPGMFRTDWAGRSMVRSERRIPDYDATFDPIRNARAARSGNQPGDPAKAGRAMVHLIESAEPPAHLLLGPDALEYVSKEMDAVRAEFAMWETVTRSTKGLTVCLPHLPELRFCNDRSVFLRNATIRSCGLRAVEENSRRIHDRLSLILPETCTRSGAPGPLCPAGVRPSRSLRRTTFFRCLEQR